MKVFFPYYLDYKSSFFLSKRVFKKIIDVAVAPQTAFYMLDSAGAISLALL